MATYYNNSTSAITIDQLKSVLSSLKTQRDVLKSTYSTNIKDILSTSAESIKVSGLNYKKVSDAFETTFKNLNTNMDALINVLEKKVIPNYSELSLAIKQMFGKDFASQMSELMGIK